MRQKFCINYVIIIWLFIAIGTAAVQGSRVAAPLVSDVDNLFLTSDALSRSISQVGVGIEDCLTARPSDSA